MSAKSEALLTWFLAGICLLGAVTALWPRLTVRRVPVEIASPDLTVSVAGAVQRPGVYELPWGARVEDAVAAAGGLAAGAEPDLVAWAAPLTAGQAVFVPFEATPTGDGRVSINSAHAWELERLPGVGPATAARIIDGRPYLRVEDLLRVRGIGDRTLERLAPLVKP